jgi:hypothetical protein
MTAPTVPTCPICGARIQLSGIVERLPEAGDQHPLFGEPGARWIVHQAGAHCHFRRRRNGRIVDAYAYLRSAARPRM